MGLPVEGVPLAVGMAQGLGLVPDVAVGTGGAGIGGVAAVGAGGLRDRGDVPVAGRGNRGLRDQNRAAVLPPAVAAVGQAGRGAGGGIAPVNDGQVLQRAALVGDGVGLLAAAGAVTDAFGRLGAVLPAGGIAVGDVILIFELMAQGAARGGNGADSLAAAGAVADAFGRPGAVLLAGGVAVGNVILLFEFMPQGRSVFHKHRCLAQGAPVLHPLADTAGGRNHQLLHIVVVCQLGTHLPTAHGAVLRPLAGGRRADMGLERALNFAAVDAVLIVSALLAAPLGGVGRVVRAFRRRAQGAQKHCQYGDRQCKQKSFFHGSSSFFLVFWVPHKASIKESPIKIKQKEITPDLSLSLLGSIRGYFAGFLGSVICLTSAFCGFEKWLSTLDSLLLCL